MNSLHSSLNIFRAIGDENRLRILFVLRDGELCVCQIIGLLRLAPSTVSKHLSILRSAGLVESRKKGRWVYCRLSAHSPFPIIGKSAHPVFQSLEKSSRMQKDRQLMEQIRRQDMDDLCRRFLRKPKGKSK